MCRWRIKFPFFIVLWNVDLTSSFFRVLLCIAGVYGVAQHCTKAHSSHPQKRAGDSNRKSREENLTEDCKTKSNNILAFYQEKLANINLYFNSLFIQQTFTTVSHILPFFDDLVGKGELEVQAEAVFFPRFLKTQKKKTNVNVVKRLKASKTK